MSGLLGSDEPAAVGCERAEAKSDFVLVCDHAGNRIPAALGDLGLSPAERERHIAWDIGAFGLARALSARLDAVLVWQNYSRLVIDCNRPPASNELIVTRSEATDVPGNRGLDGAAREARMTAIFAPYHAAIAALLDARAAAGRNTVFVAVHSFTPTYHGVARPWHLGLLYGADRRLADRLFACIGSADDLVVGDNQPYTIDEHDHTLPEHPLRRGLPNVLLELRQDLLATAEAQQGWAERLADWLNRAAAAVRL